MEQQKEDEREQQEEDEMEQQKEDEMAETEREVPTTAAQGGGGPFSNSARTANNLLQANKSYVTNLTMNTIYNYNSKTRIEGDKNLDVSADIVNMSGDHQDTFNNPSGIGSQISHDCQGTVNNQRGRVIFCITFIYTLIFTTRCGWATIYFNILLTRSLSGVRNSHRKGSD